MARIACFEDCRAPRGGLTTRCYGHIIIGGSDGNHDTSSPEVEMGNPKFVPWMCGACGRALSEYTFRRIT